jgi:flagellar protein FlbD
MPDSAKAAVPARICRREKPWGRAPILSIFSHHHPPPQYLAPPGSINPVSRFADTTVESDPVIQLTRLNHIPLVLNSDLIEHIEITPDTVITLTSGQKIMVLEAATEVVERVVAFRRSILSGILNCPMLKREPDETPSGLETV